MAFVSTQSQEFRPIAEALGLPSNTTRARLIMDAGDVVKLEVTRLVTQEELHRLGRAVKEAGCFLLQEAYVLDEDDESEGESPDEILAAMGDAAGHHGI